jgi:hypothetical protein
MDKAMAQPAATPGCREYCSRNLDRRYLRWILAANPKRTSPRVRDPVALNVGFSFARALAINLKRMNAAEG